MRASNSNFRYRAHWDTPEGCIAHLHSQFDPETVCDCATCMPDDGDVPAEFLVDDDELLELLAQQAQAEGEVGREG